MSDKLQQVAAQPLGSRNGAVVALDPTHGRHPGHVLATRPSTRTCWPATTSRRCGPPSSRLNADPGKPLLPRRLPRSATSRAPPSRSSPPRPSTTTSPTWPPRSTRRCLPCRCRRPTARRCSNFGGEACGGQLAELFRSRATPASARSASTSVASTLDRRGRGVRVQQDAADRPARRGPVVLSRRGLASSTTSPAWPCRPSASRTCRPRRWRWPWWPRPSPTAG